MNKILVVEDSKAVLSNIVKILTLNGYSVISAENGKQGLEFAKKENPDLILSDIMMPELDGLKMLEYLKNDSLTDSIPLIFLTARVDNSDLRKGMVAGADDYLIKPFRAKDLIESVETQLEKKNKQKKFLNELYNNISSYIPHELRTPLVSIYGYTDLMLSDLDSIDKDEMRFMLNSLRNSATRLHSTLEKFIKYSEAELMLKDKEGYGELNEKYVVSPHWFIQGIVDRHKHSGEIIFKHEISPDDIEINIFIDHFRLIVDELLNNAIKFSAPNKKIEIDTLNNEDKFIIRVSNFGRGMSNSEISRISPFVQHGRNTFEQNGNGLGLAIIKNLCEFYEAELNVQSEPDSYTIIEIKFPARVSLTQGIAI